MSTTLKDLLDAQRGSKLVYIAAPYAAPTPIDIEVNVARAVKIGYIVKGLGYLPIVPHLMTTGLVDEATERQVAIDLTLETARAVLRCDGQMVVLVPGRGPVHSRGVIGEAMMAMTFANNRVHFVGPDGAMPCHPGEITMRATGDLHCRHCQAEPFWFRAGL